MRRIRSREVFYSILNRDRFPWKFPSALRRKAVEIKCFSLFKTSLTQISSVFFFYQTGTDCIQIPVDFLYSCCAARPPSCLTRCPENKLINISSIHANTHLLVKVMNVLDNWSGLLADSLTHCSPLPPRCLQVSCSPRRSGWPLRPCRSAPSCCPPALAGSCSCS